MKNQFKNLMIAVAAVFLFACSNENSDVIDNNQEIADVQYFDSRSDFEEKITLLEVSNLGANPLSEILNKDNIVSIGNYFIKINTNNENVYVLNKKFANKYSDLVNENLNNPNIFQYSTYDNVLSLLENDNLKARSCGAAVANTYTSASKTNGNYEILAQGTYSAYGIYFLMYFSAETGGDNPYLEEWDITYRTTTCGSYSSYADVGHGGTDEEGEDGYFYRTVYRGTTPLSSFHIYAVFSSLSDDVNITLED